MKWTFHPRVRTKETEAIGDFVYFTKGSGHISPKRETSPDGRSFDFPRPLSTMTLTAREIERCTWKERTEPVQEQWGEEFSI